MRCHSHLPIAVPARAWINTSSKYQQLSRTWQFGKEDLSMWKVHSCKGAVKKLILSAQVISSFSPEQTDPWRQNKAFWILHQLQHHRVCARQNAPLASQPHQQCSMQPAQPAVPHGGMGTQHTQPGTRHGLFHQHTGKQRPWLLSDK